VNSKTEKLIKRFVKKHVGKKAGRLVERVRFRQVKAAWHATPPSRRARVRERMRAETR
jgi:hypothetical protein